MILGRVGISAFETAKRRKWLTAVEYTVRVQVVGSIIGWCFGHNLSFLYSLVFNEVHFFSHSRGLAFPILCLTTVSEMVQPRRTRAYIPWIF